MFFYSNGPSGLLNHLRVAAMSCSPVIKGSQPLRWSYSGTSDGFNNLRWQLISGPKLACDRSIYCSVTWGGDYLGPVYYLAPSVRDAWEQDQAHAKGDSLWEKGEQSRWKDRETAGEKHHLGVILSSSLYYLFFTAHSLFVWMCDGLRAVLKKKWFSW